MNYENVTLVNFCIVAEPHQIFTKEITQNMIGTETIFRDIKDNTHPAEIVAARIIDNGKVINITLKIDDPTQSIRESIYYDFEKFVSISHKKETTDDGKTTS